MHVVQNTLAGELGGITEGRTHLFGEEGSFEASVEFQCICNENRSWAFIMLWYACSDHATKGRSPYQQERYRMLHCLGRQ